MLVPCTVCRRHARVGQEPCPFCGGALEAPRPRRVPAGRSRVAILFGAIATASVGCGGATQPAEEPAASEPALSEPSGGYPVASEPVDPAGEPIDGDPDDDDYGSAVAEYGVPSPE